MNKYLTFEDDKSSKFWKIEVSGKSYTVNYGKLGSKGTSKTKNFSDDESAMKDAEKVLRAKLKKGYVESELEKNAVTESTSKGSKAIPKSIAKVSKKIELDYTSDDFWLQVEAEFYENAKDVFLQFESENIKESSLSFWVHLMYVGVIVYTEEEDDGDGIGSLDVPILWDAYHKH